MCVCVRVYVSDLRVFDSASDVLWSGFGVERATLVPAVTKLPKVLIMNYRKYARMYTSGGGGSGMLIDLPGLCPRS